MTRLLLSTLVLAACGGGTEPVPPSFTVLSDTLLTFEGVPSSVIVETDVRTRFSVFDREGLPRGAAVAENGGRVEVPFDAEGLETRGDVRVVGVSDSGGRAEATVEVYHGIEGLTALTPRSILDATGLSNGRIVAVATDGVWLQTSTEPPEFDGPLSTGAGDPLSVTAGPDGDFFVGGTTRTVVHFGETGEDCDRIDLPPTQTNDGQVDPTNVVDMASQWGAGSIEVMAAHDLGFSGFAFTALGCDDGCDQIGQCDLDDSTSTSTGSCLLINTVFDYRATAMAMDGDHAFTGGYTFNVFTLPRGPNQCVDLGAGDAALHPLTGMAVSGGRIWVAIGSDSDAAPDVALRGIYSVDRSLFDKNDEVDDPGAPPHDRFSDLPDDELLCLSALEPSAADGADAIGVWFGAASGAGRLVVSEGRARIQWISGYSLPGRRIRAIVQTDDQVVWIATDGGLARFILP